MTFWIVLAGVLLALWLLGRIRLGVVAAYSEAGFFLAFKIGPKQVRIIPSNSSQGVKTAKKKAVQSIPEKPKQNISDTVSTALRFIPLIGDAAGRLKRKIRIDNIVLYIVWGSPDPADAAKGYGAANAAMGILWPAVEHNFRVKEHDLNVHVDFECEKPELIGNAQITITIGQIIALLLNLGLKALNIYLGIRRDQTPKNENEKAV